MALKKTFYRLFFILLLVLMAFSLCACGSINAMVRTNSDGSIDELVTISLDQTELLKQDISYYELKSEIVSVAMIEAESMRIQLNNKIASEFFLNGETEANKHLKGFIDGIEFISNHGTNNKLVLGVKFKTNAIYKYYYDVAENSSSEPKIEKGFLFSKVSYYGSSLYIKHYEMFNRLNSYFSLKYPNLIKTEGANVSYTYVSELRRTHSNADYVNMQNGEYYHTWIYSLSEIENNVLNNSFADMMIYYNVANTANWILCAIAITLAVCLILLIIAVVISKLKKDKNLNSEEN